MKYILYFILFLCLNSACKRYTPKPDGYFRIETGEHTYKTFEGDKENPYTFPYSGQAYIQPIQSKDNSKWFNITYPRFQADIHCSFLPIRPENFILAAEDSRNFVYRHTVKADDITMNYYENPEEKISGILYNIVGNVASPVQFTLTDSTSFFFRGALYFNNVPNQDSIAPSLTFIKEDIVHLMHSFRIIKRS